MSRLAVLVFLHDCGKLHPGFQAKGWPEGIWKGAMHGHLAEGAAIFLGGAAGGQIAENLRIVDMRDWGLGASLLYASLAHHGRPFALKEGLSGWKDVPQIGYDPIVASAQLGHLLSRWFADAFQPGGEPLPDAPAFEHLFCGLVSLADWLGSDQRIFKFAGPLDEHYMEQARHRAKDAASEIGLDTARWRDSLADSDDLFSIITEGKRPRPAQEEIGRWPLDDNLVILEAETGSGKTEAALWHFARLFQTGKVDSLYFALPTRAAAKQIHDRVDKASKRLFGPGGPEAVLAVPGYLKSGEVEGKALPDFKVLWDDDITGERQNLARWAAENAKRYLAAMVAVGTVDQAMLAGLQVKHAHLRSAALSRSLLVIDEVHASDAYMSAVQASLLRVHLARGGHALLMSATLGCTARVKWLKGRAGVLPSFEEACSAPYPAIWGSGGPSAVKSDGRRKSVSMTLAPSWFAQEAATRAIAAAKNGAKVLVIRNTVDAAVEAFNAVREAGGSGLLWHVEGQPALHHSRFATEDRALLDTAVEAALAVEEKKRSTDAVIVIGTQTLEQSLDIDADFLITDLCPVDVLLQRIGRLHRHDLLRPTGFEQPQCVVLSPAEGLAALAEPKFCNGLGAWPDPNGVLQGVYRNLHACELTRRLIVAHSEWRIPDMNRLLVESATHDEPIEALNAELGPTWEHYWNKVYGQDVAEAGSARRVVLPTHTAMIASDGTPVNFLSDEEKIRTRLGAEGATLRFAEPVEGPFRQMVTGITLPAHWSKDVVTDEPVAVWRDDAGTLVFKVGGRGFTYLYMGSERHSS